MSGATFLDTDELRKAYYGVSRVMVAFSNDTDVETSGYVNNVLIRPTGVVAYPVNDVVGRKINTSKQFAHVFRLDNPRVLEKRGYRRSDLSKDVESIKMLPWLNLKEFNETLDTVVGSLSDAFDQLLVTLLTMGNRRRHGDQFVTQVLLDIGYNVFKGDGYHVILDYSLFDVFDIINAQKYRRETRSRILDGVNRINSLKQATRNRVAKYRTEANRV